jgi:hypothetical protein
MKDFLSFRLEYLFSIVQAGVGSVGYFCSSFEVIIICGFSVELVLPYMLAPFYIQIDVMNLE